MEVLVLVGGRVGGHTDRLCHEVVSSLPEDMDVTLLHISELDIAQCTGCDACKSNGGCVFDDGMGEVLRRFDDSDMVIFATPVRFNGPSSQIKTVLDRFQVLWNVPGIVGHRMRHMGLIMTAGSDNPDPNPNLKIFRSFCASFGGRWMGHVLLTGTDSVDTDNKGCARSMMDQISAAIGDSK